MQKLTVSKCCASPLLVRGGDEGTKWMTCASCKNPADQMAYPFATVGQMEAWLKRRKAYRGMAYTASAIDRRPKSRFRANLPVLLGISALILFAVLAASSARAGASNLNDEWWDAGKNIGVRSFHDEDNGLICWVVARWSKGGGEPSISCHPMK